MPKPGKDFKEKKPKPNIRKIAREHASEVMPEVARLSRDLIAASASLSLGEVRYLVDFYYSLQEYRKASGNQVVKLVKEKEPCEIISWMFLQMDALETDIRKTLDSWTEGQPLGLWCKSITGIGPVITAGLLAHIDITKAPTAGHIWRFAGLDPTQVWEKKTKRPWNARLKTLSWKIGESFVKVSGNDADFYGKLYIERKAIETAKNEKLEFARQAKEKLEKFKIGKDTDARAFYEAGKLPPAHIHARAKRYAVKLFLSHYQHVAYSLHYGTAPPKPYVIEHLGHVDMIVPPNFTAPASAKPEAPKRAKTEE